MRIFDLLYSTFLETTDPVSPYTSLISVGVLASIVLHLLVYLLIYMALAEVFDLPNDPFIVVVVLVLVMVFGYIGRLARSKSIMAVQIEHGETIPVARQIAKHTLRPAYFTWYFMG